MRDLSDIRHPVERELQWFETSFQALMASGAVFQDTIGHAAFAAGGKRLRPLLVYLCAKLFGDVNESTHRAAMFVETLHTATSTMTLLMALKSVGGTPPCTWRWIRPLPS